MTYTMLLNLTLKNATDKASTVWIMNTKYFNEYETIHTRALWPWHGKGACRSRLHDSRMLWQPGCTCLSMQGKRGIVDPNLIGHGTTKELVSDVSLVLGGGLVLHPVTISTPQHITKDNHT